MVHDIVPVSSLCKLWPLKPNHTAHTGTQATSRRLGWREIMAPDTQPVRSPCWQQGLPLDPLKGLLLEAGPTALQRAAPAEACWAETSHPYLARPKVQIREQNKWWLFEAIRFEIVCYAASDSQNGFLSTIEVCHIWRTRKLNTARGQGGHTEEREGAGKSGRVGWQVGQESEFVYEATGECAQGNDMVA